ncbi:hypothetical protein [Paenibacillus sp. Y412MC10]|uniref:hypothetical protein n=1 Tax=Geobacillus sp. (strain Y412MC10) TaxID=481743 RepID=UPI0011AB7323|nr:hypothetical protein [Paenibacillus sp. Y412MC10]
MEQLMCLDEVVILPHDTITVEFRGRTWVVDFTEWQEMSGTRLGVCLCGIRVDGDERTLVRINADYIERINNVEFKFTKKPTH